MAERRLPNHKYFRLEVQLLKLFPITKLEVGSKLFESYRIVLNILSEVQLACNIDEIVLL